jgi:cellulose synthase (UDP-forming)
MKSVFGKTGYTVLMLAVLVGGAYLLWLFFSGITPGLADTAPQGTAAKSIADMAMSYYGALSRPLFPEVSLGLPLLFQAVVSLVLVVVALLSVTLFPKARNWVMILTVGVVLRHLLWRGFDTLDLTTPLTATLSLLIYGAEIISFFALILGYFQMWGQTDHKPTDISMFAPDQLPSVDVMICTYNEPISVLYRSVTGAASIDYPKKTVYLLDDGNRAEVADMAARLGVQYISRDDNKHAKAGNLNNALANTSGDLVVVFDADHVSCKSFLAETVGFFLDEKLAFVQTPQHFFTPDPFQRNLAAEGTINNEQDLFFHVIQPGNDYWGSAFFAGSGAIFRRQALVDVGGFATETITEDTHTGLRLHAKGWKSKFYNRDLAAGMAQDSFGDFVKQRLRWARGMTQIFCVDNPILTGGLSLAQRLCYLSGIYYFFSGLPRLIFLISPCSFCCLALKPLMRAL